MTKRNKNKTKKVSFIVKGPRGKRKKVSFLMSGSYKKNSKAEKKISKPKAPEEKKMSVLDLIKQDPRWNKVQQTYQIDEATTEQLINRIQLRNQAYKPSKIKVFSWNILTLLSLFVFGYALVEGLFLIHKHFFGMILFISGLLLTILSLLGIVYVINGIMTKWAKN